jgi:hypothetical protein
MSLTTGIWNNVEEIVEWPNGVVGILMCINTGDYTNLAQILEAFTNFAETALKTTMGRARYLLGLPLTYVTMRFTTHGVTGLSATRGFFSPPQSAIPFLFDIIGVPWHNANNEHTEKAIAQGCNRNRNIISMLTKKARGQNPTPQSLQEIVDLMKTNHDKDIQNPVMFRHESVDVCVPPWEYAWKWRGNRTKSNVNIRPRQRVEPTISMPRRGRLGNHSRRQYDGDIGIFISSQEVGNTSLGGLRQSILDASDDRT